MASIKTMASTAKKSAKIISMAATMAASMNLADADVQAMECAFADMVEEYGEQAMIVDMDPFGFIA
jgi:hypothetical protein